MARGELLVPTDTSWEKRLQITYLTKTHISDKDLLSKSHIKRSQNNRPRITQLLRLVGFGLMFLLDKTPARLL